MRGSEGRGRPAASRRAGRLVWQYALKRLERVRSTGRREREGKRRESSNETALDLLPSVSQCLFSLRVSPGWEEFRQLTGSGDQDVRSTQRVPSLPQGRSLAPIFYSSCRRTDRKASFFLKYLLSTRLWVSEPLLACGIDRFPSDCSPQLSSGSPNPLPSAIRLHAFFHQTEESSTTTLDPTRSRPLLRTQVEGLPDAVNRCGVWVMRTQGEVRTSGERAERARGAGRLREGERARGQRVRVVTARNGEGVSRMEVELLQQSRWSRSR